MPFSREVLFENSCPHRGRLLVAEDNAALRSYLVAVLRAEGYDVAEAATADDLADTLAVSLRTDVGSGAFDLVIAEDRLVIREQSPLQNGRWTHTGIPPFVLIGSASHRESAAKVLGTNAVVMFDKPLDMESFRDAVRCLARNIVEARQVRARN